MLRLPVLGGLLMLCRAGSDGRFPSWRLPGFRGTPGPEYAWRPCGKRPPASWKAWASRSHGGWSPKIKGNEPFARLVVVKFTGKCACGGFLHSTREILVSRHHRGGFDGRVLPYSQVRCDAVRRLLPEIEYAADRRVGGAALGRVLGRVLAHELYHAVLGTVHHSASGLAKGFQSSVELKSDEMAFDGGDWDLAAAAIK